MRRLVRVGLALLDAPVELLRDVVRDREREAPQHVADLGVSAQHGAAHDRRRVVGREEVAVVLEHAHVVLEQFAVGRVRVDEVRLAARECGVREAVLHRAHATELEAVELGESGVAVGAVVELDAEGRRDLVGVGREVRDRVRVPALGDVLAQGERVAVVEPERLELFDVVLAPQERLHREERAQGVRDLLLAVHHRRPARAGVVRVEVDVAREQRAEADRGPAELELAHDLEVGVLLEHLRHQLGQHHGLREVLAGDDDAVGRRLRRRDRERRDEGEQFRSHAGVPP
ncbi:MAG: hypothetical protein R3F34_17975 [Planctomycetota bacterium]